MDDSDAIFSASLADLGRPADGAVLRAKLACSLKQMSIYRILELRQQICAELELENPFVRETLELIDGQIALREIARGENWR